jgi:hypothetical protein
LYASLSFVQVSCLGVRLGILLVVGLVVILMETGFVSGVENPKSSLPDGH